MLTIQKQHEKNEFSQFGEDGVLATICGALGIEKGAAVEFGAWDGEHLSNTAALRASGWTTCLIEGDRNRFAALARKFAGNQQVVPVNVWVAPDGDYRLDAILGRHFPRPIDVLSIDIDGDDFHIFQSLATRPLVIVIEYNPTIPPMVDWVNPRGKATGTGLGPMTKMAAAKGYDLVYATTGNAFFVDASRNGKVLPRTPLEVFDWHLSTFVLNAFNGENWLATASGKPPLSPYTGAPSARPLRPPVERRVKNFLRGFTSKVPRAE